MKIIFFIVYLSLNYLSFYSSLYLVIGCKITVFPVSFKIKYTN